MPSLYQMASEYQRILHLMESDDIEGFEEGEVPCNIEAELNAIEQDFPGKVDGYCSLIREFKDRSTVCNNEAERISRRAAAWDKKHKWLKERLIESLQKMGLNKLTTPQNNVTVAKNGGTQGLDIMGQVPDEFTVTKTVVETNTQLIRDKLTAGESLPFAKLKERGVHLRIS